MKNLPWSPEKIKLLLKMADDGVGNAQIAEMFGVTRKTIENKIYMARMSPEDRLKRTHRAIKRRKERERAESGYQDMPPSDKRVIVDFRPPAELIADRDYRSGLPPRDLSAAFFGDPLPGYSALERRA